MYVGCVGKNCGRGKNEGCWWRRVGVRDVPEVAELSSHTSLRVVARVIKTSNQAHPKVSKSGITAPVYHTNNNTITKLPPYYFLIRRAPRRLKIMTRGKITGVLDGTNQATRQATQSVKQQNVYIMLQISPPHSLYRHMQPMSHILCAFY